MTISFNGLGNEGRLGNQMFQYAFIRGVANNCGLKWMIPGPEVIRPDNYGLFDCFELKNCNFENNIGESSYRTIECRDMHLNEDILEFIKQKNILNIFQTLFVKTLLLKVDIWNHVKNLLTVWVEEKIVYFSMFVGDLQILREEEVKSGHINLYKNIIHCVKKIIIKNL